MTFLWIIFFTHKTELRDHEGKYVCTANKQETFNHKGIIIERTMDFDKKGSYSYKSIKPEINPFSRRKKLNTHGQPGLKSGISYVFQKSSKNPIFLLTQTTLLKKKKNGQFLLSFSHPLSAIEAFFLVLSAL